MKCDQQRPSCFSCTSTGRNCDGYEGFRASVNHQAISPLEISHLRTRKASPWNDFQLTLAHTFGFPSDEQSSRLFHIFLHSCVPFLTEALDSNFWQCGILKESSAPAVQHAAIALGAVYEQRVTSQNQRSSLGSITHNKKLELLSTVRCTTAIQVLRHRIAVLSEEPGILEEIMIACLIFIFMEILRGDDIAAVTHLDGALRLYKFSQTFSRAVIQDTKDRTTSSMKDSIEGLTKSFLRLDVQSVQYMGSRTPWYTNDPSIASVCLRKIEDIPATFESFLDARDSLYAHLANIMNFITPPEGAEKCFPAWAPHPERGFDVYTVFHGSTYRDYTIPRAATRRRYFMHILSRWKSAFQGFLQKGTVQTLEGLAGCALLWPTYHTTRINLAVSYTEDECCYDEQLPSFKKIVEQAEAYLKYTAHALPPQLPQSTNEKLADKMPSLKPKKKDFNVHSTVCYPLYYTALKCRYKPLRQRALTMLQNVDTEGIWDARMLAKVAEFVVTVEEHSIEPEHHKSLVDAPYFGVPEENRIHCLSLNMDKSQRIAWLKYNRRAMKAQGEFDPSSDPLKRWRIDNTTLTWKDTTTANADQISHNSSGGPLLPFTAPPLENRRLAY